MSSRTTIRRRRTKAQKYPEKHNRAAAIDHAIRVIYRVCCLAGSPNLIDEIRADLDADRVRAAMRKRDTGPVFDWLISALSYQGISDRIADNYMEQHGYLQWRDINEKLARGATCPKLKSYWQFYDCHYTKLRRTCAELDHISRCPLPTHDLRNGRLNQTAYALYLFIRDIADGDLIGWIDQQLQAANSPAAKAVWRSVCRRQARLGCQGRSGHGPQGLQTTSPDVAEVAKKLPVGQLYATGRAFVPNMRQSLYSDVIVALAAEPQQAAVGPADDKTSTPVARGLPRNWDEIAPGHLVIAQESLDYGWCEAIVLDRKDDMLTLRYRDYPRLPKFFRHRTAVALISPAAEQ